MSGHSHWATIRRKKGAADARRGQLFTRLAREIVIAAREGGGDPGSNMRLQFAVDKARANNMPKDSIERAIKRGTGESKEGELYEVSYEGYGPHGIALMISCFTDNKNRSVSEIRHVLNKGGGSMAEAGSVAWQFKRVAYFSFPLSGVDTDKVFEAAVEAGADDVNFDEESVEIIGPIDSFKEIGDALKGIGIYPEEAELRFLPNNPTEMEVNETLQVMRMVEQLEELDDVQAVYSTLSISDAALEQLEAA